jgi:hypothetical protein
MLHSGPDTWLALDATVCGAQSSFLGKGDGGRPRPLQLVSLSHNVAVMQLKCRAPEAAVFS